MPGRGSCPRCRSPLQCPLASSPPCVPAPVHSLRAQGRLPLCAAHTSCKECKAELQRQGSVDLLGEDSMGRPLAASRPAVSPAQGRSVHRACLQPHAGSPLRSIGTGSTHGTAGAARRAGRRQRCPRWHRGRTLPARPRPRAGLPRIAAAPPAAPPVAQTRVGCGAAPGPPQQQQQPRPWPRRSLQARQRPGGAVSPLALTSLPGQAPTAVRSSPPRRPPRPRPLSPGLRINSPSNLAPLLQPQSRPC